MIVLRTPKGWTCPEEIDGKRTGLLALTKFRGRMPKPGPCPPPRTVDEKLST
jgi:hypothetical protein